MRVGVLVPVKAFPLAKQRLAGFLSDRQRADLARWSASRVIAAAAPLPVHVICDDHEVAAWARSTGTDVIWCADVGLNTAVEKGVSVMAETGFDVAVIAHGDLPLAHRLDHVALDTTTSECNGSSPLVVTVVPDHRYDGTNVLAVPTALAGRFAFQYGRRSFPRHVREGLRHGAAVRVLIDDDLSRDLDTSEDLDHPRMGDVRAWLQTNLANHR